MSSSNKSILTIFVEADTGYDRPELLNRFKLDNILDELKDIPSNLLNKELKPELYFNNADEKLYIIFRYYFDDSFHTEEEINNLKSSLEEVIKDKDANVKLGNEDVKFKMFSEGYSLELKQELLQPKNGFVFLTDVFKSKKDEKTYSEFMNNKLSFERLKEICVKKNLPLTDDMITGVMLPIHTKHEATGSYLVKDFVEEYFEMYKVALEYLNVEDKESNEYQIGIVMSYDIKFNRYVLECTRKKLETSEYPNPDKFTRQFNKAVKRIDRAVEKVTEE